MKTSLKLLSIFSALFLVAACETAPQDENSKTGMGENGVDTSPGSQGDLEKNVGALVFFDLDSSVVTSEGQRTLERQAAWLQQYSNLSITIEGHCDERGTREYNLALGERRANAVKNYLVSLGVNAGRVSTVSYGKERPAVVGSDESAWAQNRRGYTVVSQ